MKKIIQKHNTDIENWLKEPHDEKFKRRHLQCIKCLQHERLVHLLVTLFFGLVTLALLLSIVYLPFNIYISILFAIFLTMTAIYVWHYYFLENTVQRWYKVMDKYKKD